MRLMTCEAPDVPLSPERHELPPLPLDVRPRSTARGSEQSLDDHQFREGRTPVLKADEAGVLCVDEAVSELLFALAAANISGMRRLAQQIAESDYEPPVRPTRAENVLDGKAVVRFVREQGRRVSRQEIERALISSTDATVVPVDAAPYRVGVPAR
jgi:hypothetical protein